LAEKTNIAVAFFTSWQKTQTNTENEQKTTGHKKNVSRLSYQATALVQHHRYHIKERNGGGEKKIKKKKG
jgi:hypothetical protein